MVAVKNRHVMQPGRIVFREGDEGDAIYIVERGRIEIWRGRSDQRVVLGVVTAGGVFGEMAIFDAGVRLASASATEETELIRIPADRVRAALRKADPVVEKLVRVMLESTRSMAVQLEAMALERAGFGGTGDVAMPLVRIGEADI